MLDPKLLSRFKRGDPEAVRVIYQRFGSVVFTIALRALSDRKLAEEAVQMTFTKAWQAADRFDDNRAFAPWLYTIARRAAVDVYRREKRHYADRYDDEPEIAVLPPTFEEMWEAWEVRVALDNLSEPERQVIEATHYRHLTMAEASVALDIPLGTVKSRSQRAHRRLAGILSHLREESA
jgi:RNA polymerase sigma factor (sigma-70 family)